MKSVKNWKSREKKKRSFIKGQWRKGLSKEVKRFYASRKRIEKLNE